MEQFEEITVEQAKELINEGNVTIVDIRSPDAYQESHIENALSVNDSNIDEFVKANHKNKPILCYCYMGFSSQNAAQYFKDQGFEKVYSMKGGFTEWQRTQNA